MFTKLNNFPIVRSLQALALAILVLSVLQMLIQSLPVLIDEVTQPFVKFGSVSSVVISFLLTFANLFIMPLILMALAEIIKLKRIKK